jgi:hypothetical protein
MSVPYYYQKGSQLSARMKADYRRVRATNPQRYISRVVKEQRMGPDGNTMNIEVRREPDAVPMTPRQRHDFAHGRRRSGD